MLRQKQNLSPKIKLNHTLQSWLPILQTSSDELKETLEPFVEKNPFVSIESKSANLCNLAPKSTSKKRNYGSNLSRNFLADDIEALNVYEKSLYEKLFEQIDKPLFPTQKSKDIAYEIIECINSQGYFEADDKIYEKFSKDEVEKIRARFAMLEPTGVGAMNFKESFIFQLDEMKIDDELYEICLKIIENFENLAKFTGLKRYTEAMAIIKKFKNPPAIEFLQDQMSIIPDIIIHTNGAGIEVSVNDAFYPDIVINTDELDKKDSFVSSCIKEGLDLIDALEMRKATLYKIGLMIVEYQYDYFYGGDIKPMRLKDIAFDLGRNPSTISRAISNKFLSSNRGTIALKEFFAAALDEDISNAAIKEFIQNVIAKENPKKPLSDLAILKLIQKEFDIKIVRRTITKYRKVLNIGSSSQRRKIYEIRRD